ncbi:uncharacterized protein C8R40DRAFT_1071073 [Lentinula edodes]|uniref:uncharacterized protein n=1 Tax=Lentinula edodes TaxID=5353 RepID=UPI001E8DB926|nr:uncharacterized protein C8R40DRAFT_1071073 [Lentinula edodes]KAH7873085.1 hypothetical protein C8R40DRAFT_1071073 [Lentinula edodes]
MSLTTDRDVDRVEQKIAEAVSLAVATNCDIVRDKMCSPVHHHGKILVIKHDKVKSAMPVFEIVNITQEDYCGTQDSFVAGSYPSPGPILIRKRMSTTTARNELLYVKRNFGLFDASTPLFLQAVITGSADGSFVKIDLDARAEIVPYIVQLRIIT